MIHRKISGGWALSARIVKILGTSTVIPENCLTLNPISSFKVTQPLSPRFTVTSWRSLEGVLW